MSSSYDNHGEGTSAVLQAAGTGQLAYVQKVYGYFLVGVLTCVASGGLLFAGPLKTIGDGGETFQVPSLVWTAAQLHLPVFIGLIVLSLFAGAAARRASASVALMVAYCALMGVFLTPFIWAKTLVDGPNTVALAGLLTAGTFTGLTVFTFVSKRDFNFLGAGLFVAFWGLFLGLILNAFIGSPMTHWLMCWAGVVIFGGYVLYDTNRILRYRDQLHPAFAALRIFVDVVNLFIMILSLLGGGRRR